MSILRKIFPSYNDRQIKGYEKIVEQANIEYEKLINEDKEKRIDPSLYTEKFRKRLSKGEEIDSLVPEAFALVKFVMTRLYNEKYSYSEKGIHFIWEMIPYDVQIIGGIALHEGKIVEMATGEGKTLVAVMPLYLNALIGKGAYLITVNDYLARRDRAWMNPIYNMLGIEVGLVQSGVTPALRRDEYNKDVVYVTNNEFGFDYLRDNLTYHKREKVHRDDFFFAIIDEVDSVLIDEARTPLIISGLPMDDTDQKKTFNIYTELNLSVKELVRNQRQRINEILKQVRQQIKTDDFDNGIYNLMKIRRGHPKMPELISLIQDADIARRMESMESALIRDKELHKLDEGLLFSIEERAHSIHITDEGEREFSELKKDNEFFVLPQISMETQDIDNDDDLTDQEKFKKKEELNNIYAAKSERIHSVQQLLRAYTMFVKDIDYIVQDKKVIIVDEHTGRLMPGRRFSEGIHSAIEAKENVHIEEETKTLATVTLQNLFRMFEKLSGMTGTAETEAKEFMQIYKIPTIVIPTNKPVIRDDRDDIMFIKKEDKMKFIVDEIVTLHNAGLPLLVGTASVASSEHLDNLLKTRIDNTGKKIKYNILNAKNYENEANVVAEAGSQGAITIATNMAGRGTDIKLGKTIKMLSERSTLIQALDMKNAERDPKIICGNNESIEYIKYLLKNDEILKDKSMYFSFDNEDNKISIIQGNDIHEKDELFIPSTNELAKREVCIKTDNNGNCERTVQPGLYVLGTEKHESRRIDRQLRGRSGRQGDGGVSQFTVSLEDDLMRIFGSDRMSALIGRLEGMSGEGAVSHRILTTQIENAQKRIENLNFDRRKFLLEYDDVINKQREVIYEMRDFFLYKAPPIEFVNSGLFLELTNKLTQSIKDDMNKNNHISINKHIDYLNNTFQLHLSLENVKNAVNKDTLAQLISEEIMPDIKMNIENIKEYLLDNIPEIVTEYMNTLIQAGTFKEEWPYDDINEYLMTHFLFTVNEPKEEMKKNEFIEYIEKRVIKKIEDRCNVPDEFLDKLSYVLCFSFLRAIDFEWVEQLYELEAIKEGITLRGYAQKNPLVEFKKEAYILFSVLIDNIYKNFIKRFFDSKLLSDIEEIKSSKVQAFKPQLFANSGENKRKKMEPTKRSEKKVGRNDPCWCGSGKKYKHCHGKNK